jgi:hypothetical protein
MHGWLLFVMPTIHRPILCECSLSTPEVYSRDVNPSQLVLGSNHKLTYYCAWWCRGKYASGDEDAHVTPPIQNTRQHMTLITTNNTALKGYVELSIQSSESNVHHPNMPDNKNRKRKIIKERALTWCTKLAP